MSSLVDEYSAGGEPESHSEIVYEKYVLFVGRPSSERRVADESLSSGSALEIYVVPPIIRPLPRRSTIRRELAIAEDIVVLKPDFSVNVEYTTSA